VLSYGEADGHAGCAAKLQSQHLVKIKMHSHRQTQTHPYDEADGHAGCAAKLLIHTVQSYFKEPTSQLFSILGLPSVLLLCTSSSFAP
jgi:hypothetical protein